MAESKVISIRLTEEMLAEVDRLAAKERWLTRTCIIEAGIKMMIAAQGFRDVQNPINFSPRWDEVIEFIFMYRRKVKP